MAGQVHRQHLPPGVDPLQRAKYRVPGRAVERQPVQQHQRRPVIWAAVKVADQARERPGGRPRVAAGGGLCCHRVPSGKSVSQREGVNRQRTIRTLASDHRAGPGRWLGRMLGGPYAEYLMTKMPGASNEHARAELGWRPLRPSWRIGFREDLAAAG